MIDTTYFRAYLPADRVGVLPPFRGDGTGLPVVQDGTFIWTEPTSHDALFTTWEGSQYACPRNARIRMLEAVLAFTRMYPSLPVVTEDRRLEFVGELAALRRAGPIARSYILSSAWHVPLRWFSAFAPSERELYDTPDGSSIRYRASIGEAVDRVHWASTVLASAGFAEHVVERVIDLERWLMEFSADSMVELDYATVARLFSTSDLVLDESVDDVRNSLLALERVDADASRGHYESVASRWFPAQSFTFSN